MATLLGQVTVEAARLWRDHPPLLRHPSKQQLLALAGGLERVPRGNVAISQWAPDGAERRVGPAVPLESVEGPFAYPRPEARVDAWHVNFADTELFAFYGSLAFAQDELQVAEHPVLASVRGYLLSSGHDGLRALTCEAGRPTPVLVRDVERWCAIDTDPELASPYGIYGRRLARASDETLAQAVTRLHDAPPSNVLAMVAPQGRGRYARAQIVDILTTAVTGFEAAAASSPAGASVRIHTGHWGTGAFGGNRTLMAAAQLLAARIAGIGALAYHSLDDDGVDAFREGARIAEAIPAGTVSEDAVDALDARAFTWGTSDGN